MKLIRFLRSPRLAVMFLGRRGFLNAMADEPYLKQCYRGTFGRELDLQNPKLYSEKLQWLKLYDRKPEYAQLVDKLAVREIIARKLGPEYLIPLLWSGERLEDIPKDALPQRFVIKCTHDSGGVRICRDRSSFSWEEAFRYLGKRLKKNAYWACREWPYKDLKPRLVIEEYIGAPDKYPEDYKFYCFNGEVDSCMVCKGREKGYPQFYFYDEQWNRLRYQWKEPEDEAERPSRYEEMAAIARDLSQGLPAVRVDLYNVDGKIYFGEFTFFNQGGFDTDITLETDARWGRKILLPQK